MGSKDSSVSNDGRGLKRSSLTHKLDCSFDSSVSNDGRGLKLQFGVQRIGLTVGFVRQQ